MIFLLVFVTVVTFAVVDLCMRIILRKTREAQVKRVREEALDQGIRLEFTDEAESLKRVTVDEPKARILAVDDEAVVLDSLRKILVMDGFDVDTVENGKEALGLIQKNSYDFVFTDMKMPDMDGVDVTKAVKHLRPDIDVIVITGYGAIESAVDTMKFGAMDYEQKPFTEDELVASTQKWLARRQDRIERETKPAARLITPSVGASMSKHKINVPSSARKVGLPRIEQVVR